MFELTQQLAKLSDVNPRTELHGDEHKLAADLKFEAKLSNDCLAFFDPSLKSALYRKDGAVQGELIEDPTRLAVLKFPRMGNIKWDADFPGYTTTFHIGATEKDNIVLGDCQLDNWKLDCQEGGTVGLTFRCIAHPGEGELGRLCSMIQQNVTVTMDPPEGGSGE
jgi:hypothetical protein